MRTIYWILVAGLMVALFDYAATQESNGACQLPVLSKGTQR